MKSRSNVSSWLLVAGFLAIGAVNLAINPHIVQVLQAQEGCESAGPCDPTAEPCCQMGGASCVCGSWVCPS